MNFFKSVFSDDPEPSDPETNPIFPSKSQSSNQELQKQHDSNPQSPPNSKSSISSITTAWSFGGIIKNLALKSESVIETYRRDLEEFGSGLRKETAVIREVAERAVKDLPTSLEAGAAAAQESLESMGQAIDNIGSTVADIISQRKDLILDADSDNEPFESKHISNDQLNSKGYSRIDVQIRAIQCDLNTYFKDPEDLEEYEEWKLGFELGEKGGEIGELVEGNESIEEIYNEVVPNTVDKETFWSRYFYRVYKVKKTEEARAKLVKRAISGEEEEVLSWDVDDDDYEESSGTKLKGGDLTAQIEGKSSLKKVSDRYEVESKEKSLRSENDDEKEVASELGGDDGGDERVQSNVSESNGNKLEVKSEEKLGSEGKTENGGSCKDDFSVVSSQPSMPEEEDLGWDEIEDTGSTEEIKASNASGSPNRSDLRKRLSAMEEEEDLGWDIEDDDDPVKP